MRYPLALSSHKRIVIVPHGWFAGIGSLDSATGELTLGLNHLGERGLAWFVDADGLLYRLEWRGRLKKDVSQWLGLKRQRERYSIQPATSITCADLLALVADHNEQFEEAPNARDLRQHLAARPAASLVDRHLMRDYFGE